MEDNKLFLSSYPSQKLWIEAKIFLKMSQANKDKILATVKKFQKVSRYGWWDLNPHALWATDLSP